LFGGLSSQNFVNLRLKSADDVNIKEINTFIEHIIGYNKYFDTLSIRLYFNFEELHEKKYIYLK